MVWCGVMFDVHTSSHDAEAGATGLPIEVYLPVSVVSHASHRAGRARRIFLAGAGRVYLPRLPIPVMAPKPSSARDV
jgi:hypothetical protein